MSTTTLSTKAAVLAHLKEQEDPRGVANWEKLEDRPAGLKSHGIGLTRLRKIAKQIGPNAKLAAQLWKTKLYDAKVVSLLIDDPKSMTPEQAETQVEQLQGGHLAHVFSSCDATLAKTPFVLEVLERWIESRDPVRRCCGYGLLYEVSKWKKKSAPDEAYFLDHIARVERTYGEAETAVLMSMGAALMGMGGRSKRLHARALKLARKIGPIDFDPRGKCDPFDVAKNLSSKIITDRLGITS